MRILSYLRCVAWALLLFVPGCSGAQKPELAPVRGKVCYQGKPLTGGTIVFAPDPVRNGQGPLAHADIQADGSYQLRSGDDPGAIPGWHRVTIVAVSESTAAKGQPFAVPRSLLPAKYRDPELSGLACEVVPGKDNTVNFNLD